MDNKTVHVIKAATPQQDTQSKICPDIEDQFLCCSTYEDDAYYQDDRDPVITSSPNYPLPPGHLGCILYNQMDKFADRIAQINCLTGGMDTFMSLKQRSTCVAQALRQYGLKAGDIVLIFSRNIVEVYDVFLACLYLGVTVTSMHAEMGRFGITHLLFTIQPKVIFCEYTKIEKVKHFLSRIKISSDIIYFGTSSDTNVKDDSSTNDSDDLTDAYQYRRYSDTDINQILKTPNDECNYFNVYKNVCNCCRCAHYCRVVEKSDYTWTGRIIPFYTLIIDTEDTTPFELIDIKDPSVFPAILAVSYGKAGLLKSVIVTHSNLIYQMTILASRFDTTRSILHFTSLYRLIGVVSFLHAMYVGATRLYYPRFFSPGPTFKAIEKYKPNLLLMPPYELFGMLKYQMRYRYNLSCIKDILVGPNIVSNRLKTMCYRLFPEVSITVWYGYTELGIISMTSRNTMVSHTVGRLLPGIKAKVIIPETHADTHRTETGELYIQMPTTVLGYYDQNEDDLLIDSEHWFHSAEYAYFDFSDRLFIRKTNPAKICQKGYTYTTFEVETVLIGHPMIRDAVVVKVPDIEEGELAAAFIVPERRITLTIENIKTFLSENLAGFKRASAGIKFMNKMPKVNGVPNRALLTHVARINFEKTEEERTKRAQRRGINYLKDRKVVQFMKFLMGHLLSDQPDNPIRYLQCLLGQCIKFRNGKGPPPYLFEYGHVLSLCHELAGPHGGLSEQNYHAAMKAMQINAYHLPLGRNKYNLFDIKPFISYAQELEARNIKKLVKITHKIKPSELLEKKKQDDCLICI